MDALIAYSDSQGSGGSPPTQPDLPTAPDISPAHLAHPKTSPWAPQAGPVCSSSSTASEDSSSGSEEEEPYADAHPRKKARTALGQQSTAGSSLQPSAGLTEWEPPALVQGASVFDQPSAKHQGRTRTFVPVDGQYPTTVYIPVVLGPTHTQALHQLITALQQLLPDLQPLCPLTDEHGSIGQAGAGQGPASGQPGGAGQAPVNNKEAVVHPAQAGPPHRAPASSSHVPPAQQASQQPRVSRPAAPGAWLHQPAAGVASGSGVTGDQGRGGEGPLGWHISVSRCLPVRYAQLETLLGALRDELQQRMHRFELTLEQPCCFVNDEGSRTFISLPVVQGKTQVCQAVRAVDTAFRIHRLQTYYEDPQPHMSIAWLLGSKKVEVEEALAAVAGLVAGQGADHVPDQAHVGAVPDQGDAARDGGAGVAPAVVPLACMQRHHVTSVVCRVGKVDHVVWSS